MILVTILENGQLIEEGNHITLYKAQTKYYDMWQKQLEEFQVEVSN